MLMDQTRVVSGSFTVEFDSGGKIHRGDLLAEKLNDFFAVALNDFMEHNTSPNVSVKLTYVESEYHVTSGTPSASEVVKKKKLPRAKKQPALKLVPKTGTQG